MPFLVAIVDLTQPSIEYSILNWHDRLFSSYDIGNTVSSVIIIHINKYKEQHCCIVHVWHEGFVYRCRTESSLAPLIHVRFWFVCNSLVADMPQRARLPIPPTARLQSCLWTLRVFPSLPGSRLMNCYRDASSTFLQLVNKLLIFTWLTFPRFPLRTSE